MRYVALSVGRGGETKREGGVVVAVGEEGRFSEGPVKGDEDGCGILGIVVAAGC